MREGQRSQTVPLVATGACCAEAREAAERPATHATVPTTEFPAVVSNPACRGPALPKQYPRDDGFGCFAQWPDLRDTAGLVRTQHRARSSGSKAGRELSDLTFRLMVLTH